MKRTSNVAGVDRNMFNTIVLPQSLFESLNKTSENYSRVGFTLYMDDVFFYVSTIPCQYTEYFGIGITYLSVFGLCLVLRYNI